MNALEMLVMMRRKVAAGWTQGCSARNRGGFPVVPYSDDACQWCLIGSMTATKSSISYFESRLKARDAILRLISDRNEKPDLALYNDAEGRTREEVLELLDEAIQMVSVGGY